MIDVRDTPCSRSCGCWNPYGFCINRFECRHHKTDYIALQDKATAPTKRHTSPQEGR